MIVIEKYVYTNLEIKIKFGLKLAAGLLLIYSGRI